MSKTPLITIIMATLLEADPFPQALELEKTKELPFPVYQGDDINLVISGIGKTSAAAATAYACLEPTASWICNLGAAGATGSRSSPGDIYQISRVIEPDRITPGLESPVSHTPAILPGFQIATLATQDQPVITPVARHQLSSQADLLDMEAASVIQVTQIFKTPCLLFKFVSDTPERPGHNDVAENIRHYRASFCRFFVDSVIPVIRNTPLPS